VSFSASVLSCCIHCRHVCVPVWWRQGWALGRWG
jgi:hypothetical protein